jgi:para-aminobenzoate synthetase / 4-amino-4-deoxychorismate lyase
LIALRDGERRGLHAAGFIAYEAGYALEPKLSPLSRAAGEGEPPLLWFGLFESFEETEDASRLLPDPSSAWLSAPGPLLDRADYEARVEAVKEHIRAGDIYQANLTFQSEVRTAGSPIAVYSALRARAQGGHGGLVHTGTHWLISCSPELFFTLERGTSARRPSPRADEAAAEALPADAKQRAENLMIVDLLRNDLSRVSKPGTVKVPSLFEVETYPTVHQLVSTVTSRVEEGVGPVDVIEAIFPCGSITGAPKIRAMEIIAGLETEPRGPYTGAIGSIAPDGAAAFNVAIRTLALREGDAVARLGLGAGIVVDSRAEDEWGECLVKGAFVASKEGFDLIETMRFDPHGGIAELERHLQRMKKSAELFGYPFDRHAVRNELQAATFRLPAEKKLRLLLSKSGAIAIEARPMPRPPVEPVAVKLAPLPISGEDFRLRHKSSRRAFYDEARRNSGAFEVIFEDAEGFLSEGSFSSLFVEREGRLLTPPLGRGLLPGILREKLIEEGRAIEADLKAADLRDGFYIGNAVRGLIRAVLA